MSNSNSSSSRVGFGGLLAIVFIVLKLTHVIDWSWWWVLAPLWGGLALIFIAVGTVALTSLIIAAVLSYFKK